MRIADWPLAGGSGKRTILGSADLGVTTGKRASCAAPGQLRDDRKSIGAATFAVDRTGTAEALGLERVLTEHVGNVAIASLGENANSLGCGTGSVGILGACVFGSARPRTNVHAEHRARCVIG